MRNLLPLLICLFMFSGCTIENGQIEVKNTMADFYEGMYDDCQERRDQYFDMAMAWMRSTGNWMESYGDIQEIALQLATTLTDTTHFTLYYKTAAERLCEKLEKLGEDCQVMNDEERQIIIDIIEKNKTEE